MRIIRLQLFCPRCGKHNGEVIKTEKPIKVEGVEMYDPRIDCFRSPPCDSTDTLVSADSNLRCECGGDPSVLLGIALLYSFDALRNMIVEEEVDESAIVDRIARPSGD